MRGFADSEHYGAIVVVSNRNSVRYKKKRKGLVVFISVLILIVTFSFCHYYINAAPLIKESARLKIKETSARASTESAQELMLEAYSYKDFTEISQNSEGEITLLQINSILISSVSMALSLKTQEKISALLENGVQIPFGAFTGITYFAGAGKDITVKIFSAAILDSAINSAFSSVGINQTLHRIVLEIYLEIVLIFPGKDMIINIQTDVLLTESVIIGKIPSVYLDI